MRPRLLLPLALIIAAALPAALLTADPARGFQHIANGGFEDGASGWGTDGQTTIAVSADAASDGLAGAHLSGGGPLRLSYIIDGALAEGSYVLSARVRLLSADAEVTLRLAPDGWGPMQATSLVPGGSWTEVTAAFNVASAAGASIRISIDADDAYVDEVTLDGAPPVTLTPTPTVTPVPASADATAAASGTPALSATPTTTPVLDAIAAHVRNPGFEEVTADGAPFAWEKYGGVLTSDGGGRAGLAARLESTTDSTKWLHQAVTVHGGAWYAFGAWVLHNDPDVASAFLRVSWYASADASGEALSTADSAERLSAASSNYRHLATGSVQAPSSARSARVRVMLAPHGAAPAAISVDDVTWDEASPVAPSPTATRAAAPAGDGDTTTAGSTASRTAATRRSSVRGAQGTAATFIGARSDARLVINEVLYDADGEATDSDLEWIELYNGSDAAVDVAGWALVDGASVDVLPTLLVPAGGFAIVAATDAFFAEHPAFTGAIAVLDGRIGNGLGNDGDALFLLDPSGRAADAVSWGDNAFALNPAVADVPEGHSIERISPGADSNVADDWIDNESPSPGKPYAAGQSRSASASASTIEIIEGAGGQSWDWLPWALVAASAAALAGMLGWRTVESVRARLRQQP